MNNKFKIDNITLDDHKKISNVKKSPNINVNETNDNNKMPKWKKESEQFRAAMKRGKEPDSVIVYKNKNMNQPMKR